MEGQVVAITGANSGIGKEMARALAGKGAKVVLVCRSLEKGEAAAEEIRRETGSRSVEPMHCDVSELASVVRFADHFRSRYGALHVLMNNAGVYLPQRRETSEGHEATFATNHLGVQLLTVLLLPVLRASAPSRVVTTSSAAHHAGRIDLEDLEMRRRYSGMRQYCNTKLMNLLFTRELSRRVIDEGICASAFHPGPVASGFAQDEPGLFGHLVRLSRPFLLTPQKGATAGIHLATSVEGGVAHGAYYQGRRAIPSSRRARDPELARRLWEATEAILRAEVGVQAAMR